MRLLPQHSIPGGHRIGLFNKARDWPRRRLSGRYSWPHGCLRIMSSLYARNECEACQVRPRVEDLVVAHLRERISELEHENENLRKLDQALHRNSYVFDVLLRASEEGILLLSPEWTILRVIHSALGYAQRDLVGQSLLAVIHPDDVERMQNCSADTNIDFRALDPNRKWIWLRGYVTDMLDDPNVQAIVLNSWRIKPPSPPLLFRVR